MVIKNWCFVGTTINCPQGTPTYLLQNPWVYRFVLNATGDSMYPAPAGGFGDLTNLDGIPGQNETAVTVPPWTPVEKVFGYHFIVQVAAVDDAPLSGDQFFDPSYGVTYSSAAGFEAQAVAGYASQFPPDNASLGQYHVFTPISGFPDISFSPPIQARSM
jgi:hypothetical protein